MAIITLTPEQRHAKKGTTHQVEAWHCIRTSCAGRRRNLPTGFRSNILTAILYFTPGPHGRTSPLGSRFYESVFVSKFTDKSLSELSLWIRLFNSTWSKNFARIWQICYFCLYIDCGCKFVRILV
jgi:hypothetical protein